MQQSRGCPIMSDRSTYQKAAVLLQAAQTIDAVTLSSGNTVGSSSGGGYHLTGGTVWYTADPGLTEENWQEANWVAVGGL